VHELSRPVPGWADLGEILGGLPGTDAAGASREANAIVALYDAHQRDLYGFARSALDDPGLADDFVQESFLRLVREIRAGRMPDNPGGWLYRVCANLIISDARRRRVTARGRLTLRRHEAASSAEDESLRREEQLELADALRRLPAEGRLALLLAAQGLSGREIAAALGRTESAARTILCRARRRLREEVARGTAVAAGAAAGAMAAYRGRGR
jgi:RNA polymerase sigma-70 factor, ECF subfamily